LESPSLLSVDMFLFFSFSLSIECRYVCFFLSPSLLSLHIIFEIVKIAWMQFNAIQLNWHLVCFLEINFYLMFYCKRLTSLTLSIASCDYIKKCCFCTLIQIIITSVRSLSIIMFYFPKYGLIYKSYMFKLILLLHKYC
jgi:hypothetical protein